MPIKGVGDSRRIIPIRFLDFFLRGIRIDGKGII